MKRRMNHIVRASEVIVWITCGQHDHLGVECQRQKDQALDLSRCNHDETLQK